MNNRADRFHVGQVWESPRGFFYRVMRLEGMYAILRPGWQGIGRKVVRDFDAVANWKLVRDPEESRQNHDTEPSGPRDASE